MLNWSRKQDTKALYEGDESYKIKLDVRYLIQFWTPFLGSIRSLTLKL